MARESEPSPLISRSPDTPPSGGRMPARSLSFITLQSFRPSPWAIPKPPQAVTRIEQGLRMVAEFWLHIEHGRDTADDGAGGRRAVRARRCRPAAVRLRLVDDDQHDILRIVDRESREEGVEV